nr:MAG TPA: minor tail protein [Caudoviricetes sp.]
MTGIVEITRSGSKAARGLISIQSRYNQIIDETSSTGQKLSKWYKDHDIEIKNEEGQQRKLYDTLTDVSKIWNTLTKDEQLYYLNIQAGANQTQNLAAALSNFAQVQEAHQIALNSENSALDENARAMENLNKKIKAIKDSWAELVLAFANSEAIGDLLDRVNSALRSLAENEEAISTITKIAKALLIIKGFKIAGSLFSGAIGSAKDFLSVLKKIVSRLGDIGALFSLIKTEGLGATIAGLAPALASIAPYAAVFLGLGAAVGVLTGKFKELYNQHIAKTSDDLGKVANAYLNLIEAKKAYEGEQGTRYKTVTGQEALNEEIESLNKLINQYNQGKITISNFQKQVGDISQLEKYYNALQAMIDNNITLTSEQQNNYNALKKVLDGYNGINSSLETHREALKGLKEDVGKLNGVYKSSQSIYSVYKSSLQKIGGTYYFTSQAAKDSAIATQKAIIAEAESVIAQTENEIKAREQLAKVMSASSPTTSKLMKNVSSDMFSKTKLKSPDALVEDVASKSKDKWENVIATSQKAIAELNKIKVYNKGVSGGGGGGDGKGKKEKKDYLSIYKKRLEEYQKAQKDAYQKGEISASEYYSNVQKRGKSYYNKLKKMGSDYASDAKSMLDTYKQYNTTAVKDIFSEIEYRYKEGQIDGEKYYNELWKYAKKFYKNGKIDFDSYRDYIKKGYTALFDNLKKQYESGQLTAEQYQKKVDEAQKKSEKSIRQSVKSGALDKSMVKVTRNALVDAAYASKNEVAKALKQAAIEAAEAAVEAAQKKLEEAQKRQDRANAFISALQFYADEQTEAIDKTIDGYNEQIEKLNEQLDLMDEQNDALDKQAERIKLVNALEEAKKQKTVRVYDSSLGWVD